jgi:hypothetical protein
LRLRTKFVAVALLSGLAAGASACHSWNPFKSLKGNACNKPGAAVYDRAQSIPPLKTPPGLDAPDTHAGLRIPDLNEPAPPQRRPTDPCLDEPPPFATPKPKPPPAA